YVGYAAAQVKGLRSATRCGALTVGRIRLSLNAQGVRCRAARKAVRALDRAPAVRGAHDIAENVAISTAGARYLCDVDGRGKGRSLRAVSCQSGSTTLWWSAARGGRR
ncbi:MAG: hypothetical protein QOJ85_4519, partial [Solirubrobacteraceae bacterium]|nr:hypothetical protein [Solirubrobacteraceae bacterium]